MRKILVIKYSQTGQLTRITNSIITPFQNNNAVQVDELIIEPEVAFGFPWSFFKFFQVMPESVYLKPIALKPLDPVISNTNYDLIILPYQVWFLSPSLPISSFLQSPEAKKLFNNTPVVTVIGCRGMWLTAQEKMKGVLKNLNAKLVDNVVLTDECGAGFSFLATPLWMLTGKKKALSWIPQAGVSEQDIVNAKRFGVAINNRLNENANVIATPMLQGLKAVSINEKFIFSEKLGHRSFKVWGKLLMLMGPQNSLRRNIGLCVYFTFLLLLIITVVPISALIIKLLTPLLKNKISQQKAYFSAPSGE